MKIRWGRFCLYCLLTVMTVNGIAATSLQAFRREPSIFLFVSFSMPNESIKGWMRDGAKVGAPVIIRGLVNHSFKETVNKMTMLTQDNRGGVQIDPTAFQRFSIKQVPAVVVTSGEACPDNQSCLDHYDVVYGDVTLEYALQKIAKQQSAASKTAEAALLKLKQGVL